MKYLCYFSKNLIQKRKALEILHCILFLLLLLYTYIAPYSTQCVTLGRLSCAEDKTFKYYRIKMIDLYKVPKRHRLMTMTWKYVFNVFFEKREGVHCPETGWQIIPEFFCCI